MISTNDECKIFICVYVNYSIWNEISNCNSETIIFNKNFNYKFVILIKRYLINIFEKNTFRPDPEKDRKYIRKKVRKKNKCTSSQRIIHHHPSSGEASYINSEVMIL